VGALSGFIRVYRRSMDAHDAEGSVVELGKRPGRVAITPDARMIATVTEDRLTLIDAAEGRVVRTAAAPSGRMLDRVAFSPDGRLVAATSVDGVHLWTAADGQLRATLRSVHDRDAGYVLGADGEIEVFGDAADLLACRFGQVTFPFELCAHRFSVPHLAARAREAKHGG
jgi:hypothetical protein